MQAFNLTLLIMVEKGLKKVKKKYDADPDDAFLALDVELFERKNWTEQFHRWPTFLFKMHNSQGCQLTKKCRNLYIYYTDNIVYQS